MKKAKTNNRKITILAMIIGAGLIIAFVVAMVMKFMQPRKPTENNSVQEKETGQTLTEPKEKPSAEEQPATTETPQPTNEAIKTPPKYQGEVQESPDKIVGNIVTKRIIGDNLVINVMIREMVGGGNCELELKSRTTGKKIEIKNRIMNDVSTSHCESFRIPRSSLTSGTWEIDIEMEAGRKKGEIKDEVTL